MNKEKAEEKYIGLLKSTHDQLNALRQIDYQIKRDGFKEYYIKTKAGMSFSDVSVPLYKVEEIKNKVKEFRLQFLRYKDMNTEELRHWARRRGVKYITELNNDQLVDILEKKEAISPRKKHSSRPTIDKSKSSGNLVICTRQFALGKCGISLKGIKKKKKESTKDYVTRKATYIAWVKEFDSKLQDYRAYRAMNLESVWEFYESVNRINEYTKMLYSLAKEVRRFARSEPTNNIKKVKDENN